MAYAQIQQFGFNDVVGLVSFEPPQQGAGGRRPFSKRLAATMDHEARKLIAEAYQKTEAILNVRNTMNFRLKIMSATAKVSAYADMFLNCARGSLEKEVVYTILFIA